MTAASAILLGLASLLAAELAGLEVTTKKDADRLEVKVEGGVTFVDVYSPKGIGAATLEPKGGWPAKIVLRLHLTGLESLRVSSGKTTLAWAVSSSGGGQRMERIEGKTERPVARDDPLWTDARVLDAQGKPATAPVEKGGRFEVPLPKALFDGGPKRLDVHWIDFYRG